MAVFASVSLCVNRLRNYIFWFHSFPMGPGTEGEVLRPPVATMAFRYSSISLNKGHKLPTQMSQQLTSWFSHRGLRDSRGLILWATSSLGKQQLDALPPGRECVVVPTTHSLSMLKVDKAWISAPHRSSAQAWMETGRPESSQLMAFSTTSPRGL